MDKQRTAPYCIGFGYLLMASPLWSQPSFAPLNAPPLSTIPQAPIGNPTEQAPPTLELSRQLHPQQPPSIQIDVRQIAIAGVNAVAFEQIANVFQPLTGQTVSLEKLAQATTQASAIYQKAGYPLSFVYLPEQSFQNGLVQILAVEGYASDVHLIGDSGRSTELLQSMVQPLLAEKPLSQQTFERQTLLMASLENLKVGASAPMPNNPSGATPLQLRIDRQPALFNVTAELRQGDPKAIANFTLNDPLWGGSQWRMTALLDDPQKERFVSADFRQWLNAEGTQMRLSVIDFKGQDNFAQNLGSDTSKQRRWELNLSHPLILSAAARSTLGGSFYSSNYEKIYDFPSLGITVQDLEKVRALQVNWNGYKAFGRTQHNASASLTQGIDGMDAGSIRSSNLGLLPSSDVRYDFSRATLDYSVHHRFPSKTGLAFGIGGQYSPHQLPVTERIAFGGSRFGRGYRAGEAAGDRGVGYSLEASHIFEFKNRKWISSFEPYVLYEQAQTWFKSDGFIGQKLKSTSLGVRISDGRYYALDVAIAKPQGDKSPINPEQKLRYSISLNYQLNP